MPSTSTKPPPFTKKDIPSQTGKICIVTGGTGGLGYEVALALAEAGAKVIVAGRDLFNVAYSIIILTIFD